MKKVKFFFRHAVAVATACVGMTLAPQANAVLVDSVGDSFSVQFFGNQGALNATAQFTVTDWDTFFILPPDHVEFNVGLTNNSLGANSRLTALSILDIDPNLVGADASNGWDAVLNTNAGGGYNPVDLCMYDGQNCNGGGNQGVAGNGGFEQFALDLNFLTLSSAGLNLDGFIAKFQTDNGSFHLLGCIVGTPGCTPPTSVPEPATVGLLGLGLLGLGVARRKRT